MAQQMIVIGSIEATYEFTSWREWEIEKNNVENYQLLKYFFFVNKG